MEYPAAHHRKKGKSVEEIAEAVGKDREAARQWLVQCHREGAGGLPRRKAGDALPNQPARHMPGQARRQQRAHAGALHGAA